MKINLNRATLSVLAIMIVIAASLLPEVSSAFVPEDLDSLKETKKCPGCDLRGADLKGANLAGANLEGANLLGANLEGANLEGANLEDSSCEKANLLKSRLNGVRLEGANLEDVVWSDGRVCQKGSVGSCK